MLTKEALDSLSTDPERANWRRIAAYGLLRAFDFTGCEIEGSRRTLCYRAEVGEHFLLLMSKVTPPVGAGGRIFEEKAFCGLAAPIVRARVSSGPLSSWMRTGTMRTSATG